MLAYALHEITYAALEPARAAAQATRLMLSNPFLSFTCSPAARGLSAACEMVERLTRRYPKPGFNIASAEVAGAALPVAEEVVWETPFCRLLRFSKGPSAPAQPKLLLVAPMSGHYATLLRGTVEAMLPTCDVHITDWVDARLVPLSHGSFDLDDYIDHVRDMLRHLGPGTHVMAVCQPSVPVLAAVALMEEDKDPCAPASMTLMGGPIDTRASPTAVNDLATERGIDWFRNNVITTVPASYPGFMRRVYPGFLQLTGFVSMNPERHLKAHQDLFGHLVSGDDDAADKTREFYDEYFAVMDMTAEFYLQTIDTVFIRHALPRGEMTYRGRRIDPSHVRRTALMTVEGEKDDISGLGQTQAAHGLCANIPDHRRVHHVQPGVGHYGVFSGRRFTAEIAPRIAAFIQASAAPRRGRPPRRRTAAA